MLSLSSLPLLLTFRIRRTSNVLQPQKATRRTPYSLEREKPELAAAPKNRNQGTAPILQPPTKSSKIRGFEKTSQLASAGHCILAFAGGCKRKLFHTHWDFGLDFWLDNFATSEHESQEKERRWHLLHLRCSFSICDLRFALPVTAILLLCSLHNDAHNWYEARRRRSIATTGRLTNDDRDG